MRDVSEVVAREAAARGRERVVRLLAEALVSQLQIPAGVQLVMLIADGRTRDNREAVRVWVARELPAELGPDVQVYLESLRQRLAAQLRRIGEGVG